MLPSLIAYLIPLSLFLSLLDRKHLHPSSFKYLISSDLLVMEKYQTLPSSLPPLPMLDSPFMRILFHLMSFYTVPVFGTSVNGSGVFADDVSIAHYPEVIRSKD